MAAAMLPLSIVPAAPQREGLGLRRGPAPALRPLACGGGLRGIRLAAVRAAAYESSAYKSSAYEAAMPADITGGRRSAAQAACGVCQ